MYIIIAVRARPWRAHAPGLSRPPHTSTTIVSYFDAALLCPLPKSSVEFQHETEPRLVTLQPAPLSSGEESGV